MEGLRDRRREERREEEKDRREEREEDSAVKENITKARIPPKIYETK